MSQHRRRAPGAALRLAAAGLLLASTGSPAEVAVSGYAGAEIRAFAHRPAFASQRHDDGSLVLRPEFHHAWNDGDDSVLLVPYLRLDSADGRRSHFDLREALYLHARDRYEVRLGIGKVFWGVTESRHLVDVINQSDLVEDLDGEDKLGQPMIDVTLKSDFGTLDLFVLPGFRERTFPGPVGRLRNELVVDVDRASYESPAGRGHVDFALRWAHYMGDVDIGLSHFYGTSREPRLVPARDGAGNPILAPRYDLVHRSGLDLQVTRGAWLWKLEAAFQSGQGPSHLAWVGGVEVTAYGTGGSATDVGLLAEHLFDSRGAHATQPFENDLFLATRVAFNDVQGSALLAGVIHDLGGQGDVLALEASRRIGDRWRLELEARLWSGIAARDLQRSLRSDDHVLLRVLRYF